MRLYKVSKFLINCTARFQWDLNEILIKIRFQSDFRIAIIDMISQNFNEILATCSMILALKNFEVLMKFWKIEKFFMKILIFSKKFLNTSNKFIKKKSPNKFNRFQKLTTQYSLQIWYLKISIICATCFNMFALEYFEIFMKFWKIMWFFLKSWDFSLNILLVQHIIQADFKNSLIFEQIFKVEKFQLYSESSLRHLRLEYFAFSVRLYHVLPEVNITCTYSLTYKQKVYFNYF